MNFTDSLLSLWVGTLEASPFGALFLFADHFDLWTDEEFSSVQSLEPAAMWRVFLCCLLFSFLLCGGVAALGVWLMFL